MTQLTDCKYCGTDGTYHKMSCPTTKIVIHLLQEKRKTLLWLDDARDPYTELSDGSTWLVFSPLEQPYDVVWVKSYEEFVDWINKHGLPDAICFDHDLGMPVALDARAKGMSKRQSRKLKQEEKTGMDCAKWLVDYCIDNNEKLPLYNIQSANPVGKENIDSLLKNFIKHQSKTL